MEDLTGHVARIPALLTRMSILPNAFSVSAAIRSPVSLSPMSPLMVMALRPFASKVRLVSAAPSSSHG
jgi:hypothetical protein